MKCNEALGESVQTFLTELRKCSIHHFLDDALRDRCVCGLRMEQAQTKPLSEADLILTKALQTAQFMEVAHTRAKEMKGGKSSIFEVSETCYPVENREMELTAVDTRSSSVTNVEKLDILCLLVN